MSHDIPERLGNPISKDMFFQKKERVNSSEEGLASDALTMLMR